MTTFALLHGSGDGGWAWHLVQRALEARGHRAVAPDLPTDREDATWQDCVATVVDAVDAVDAVGAGGGDLVVVGHSAGAFVVPLVAERLAAARQVYVAGMVPWPGETAMEWFGSLGWTGPVPEDPREAFFEGVPEELAQQAMARERPTSGRLADEPWPLASLPQVPSRYVVTTRDRCLPVDVQRRAAQRLGITHPEAIASGHCPHLACPEELADLIAGPAGEG